MSINSELVERNLVRFAELVPSKTAFIDARTPGSHLKDNYCIVGSGVAEDPNQHVHIVDHKGFDFGGAGQPVGIVNSLHSHSTAELFMVYRGEFRLFWGNEGEQELTLRPGDIVSIPTNCFRGFEVVGNEFGFLFAVLGGDESGGGVVWHPEVISNAKSYGLVLLESGTLVDTTSGGVIPTGDKSVEPLTPTQMETFRNISVEQMLSRVVRREDYNPTMSTPLVSDGVTQFDLFGSGGEFQVSTTDGFCVAAFEIASGCRVPNRRSVGAELLVNFLGDTLIAVDGHDVLLTPGDTFNCPKDVYLSLTCTRGAKSVIYSISAESRVGQDRFELNEPAGNLTATDGGGV